MPMFVFLWTDFVLWLVVLGVVIYAWRVRGNRHRLATWRHVTHDAPAMAAVITAWPETKLSPCRLTFPRRWTWAPIEVPGRWRLTRAFTTRSRSSCSSS